MNINQAANKEQWQKDAEHDSDGQCGVKLVVNDSIKMTRALQFAELHKINRKL